MDESDVARVAVAVTRRSSSGEVRVAVASMDFLQDCCDEVAPAFPDGNI